MKYYKVKPKYDNKKRYKWNKQGESVADGILIGDELYTETEFRKIANLHTCFDEVEIKKTDTYVCFGARFAI